MGKDFRKEEEDLLHSLHLAAPAAPPAAPPAREVAVGALSQPLLVAGSGRAPPAGCSAAWSRARLPHNSCRVRLIDALLKL